MSTKINTPPKHPSGRPVRQDECKRLPIVRPTYDEPLTARLRPGANRDAIGFLHRLTTDDRDPNAKV